MLFLEPIMLCSIYGTGYNTYRLSLCIGYVISRDLLLLLLLFYCIMPIWPVSGNPSGPSLGCEAVSKTQLIPKHLGRMLPCLKSIVAATDRKRTLFQCKWPNSISHYL